MPSLTPFFVISSKVTRLGALGSSPRMFARCQLMASPSDVYKRQLKVSIRFRGREMAHTSLGLDVHKRFAEALAG